MKWTAFAALPLLFVAPNGGAEVSDALLSERNLATAHFRNENYGQAAARFAKAAAISRDAVEDRINRGLSAMRADDHAGAVAILTEARKLAPDSPHVAYLLGISYARLSDYPKARDEFQRLLVLDPLCAPAHYNLGLALKRLDLLKEAEVQWKKTLEFDPIHAPAYFALFNYYLQHNRPEEAKRALEGFERTKKEQGGAGWSLEAVEKSRYTTPIPYPSTAEKEREGEIPVAFQDATAAFGLTGVKGASDALLADLDGDGTADLVLGGRVFRNKRGAFTDVSERSGYPAEPRVTCLETGDLDGDGRLDLVACRSGGLTVHHGNGDLTFRAVDPGVAGVCGPKMRPTRVRAVDFDHEGDLDLVVLCAGEKPAGKIVLLRNNGNGTFKDVTGVSNLETNGAVGSDVLASDFDGGNDIDFLFTVAGAPPRLFLNRRDGSFRPDTLGSAFGVLLAVAVGDVNGDGTPDLVTADSGGTVRTWLNDGHASFLPDHGSPVFEKPAAEIGARAVALVDIDNDGDLDLFLTTDKGPALFRNDFVGGWTDDSHAALHGLKGCAGNCTILHGDLDNDGDQDVLLVPEDGRVTALRNDGGNKNRALRIRLLGRKNNSDGYGAKIWLKDGRFSVFRENFGRWTDLGVGQRKTVQTIGVRWPTGIEQSEIDLKTSRRPRVSEIAERPGLAESCPFVYAFDGQRFRFVTDLLDTTPVGISLAPGVPFTPNRREAVLIEGSRLKPTADGWLQLKITQELAEITYLDRLRLYVVDHPEGSAIVPNDRFSDEPFAPFQIHLVEKPRPPEGAWDAAGRSVRDSLLHADRNYAFEVPYVRPRYPGVTKRWELVLDPGDVPEVAEVRLFLRGTMLWSDASVNFAVSQNPDVPLLPISLDVIGRGGQWKNVRSDLGVPAGVDKFLPVDLTGLFENSDHRIRLSSTFAVLWDQAFFSIRDKTKAGSSTKMQVLLPLEADLHFRGFSKPFSPDGRLPDLFDYSKRLSRPPFPSLQAGRYTRYGDVRSVLARLDDEYVVMAPGDEMSVGFPAQGLGEPPEGWRRDYVLDADGYIKDADWRTASGSTVGPLPFRKMEKYPPPKDRGYPAAQHGTYLETFQTRILPEDLWIRADPQEF